MTGEIIPLDGQTTNLEIITRELVRDPHLKSNHTLRSYRSDLATLDAWRAGRPLSKLLVEEYMAELEAAGRSPNTINRMLAAVRWWARRVADLAQEDNTLPTEQVEVFTMQANRVATVNYMKNSRLPKGRHINSGELAALMQACELDPSPAGVRDAAMIALGWSTGARRNEIASLKLSDLIPKGDGILSDVPEKGSCDLLIRGKVDKVRPMYILDGAFSALSDWLAVRGNDPGPLFCAIGKGSKIHPERPLSGEAMRLILDDRIRQTGVKPLTWHDFRRTFAENLLDGGNDLVTVQKMMGHVSPITTSNYDRRGDEVNPKAVRVLFVPYNVRRR
jgi:site-specific recombinase XerD